MDRLTLYDYLSFVLPGALILFVAVYGDSGWPRGEPGAAATLGLVAAAFVIGYLNAALGNLVESVMLGGKPGGRADPLWGTLGDHSTYTDQEKAAATSALENRYGVPVAMAYRMAYTELSQTDRDCRLQIMNQHLGFARGMATACAIGFVIELGLVIVDGSHLPAELWLPLLAAGTGAFTYRFRHFWRRFGDHVLRAAMVLQRDDAASIGPTDGSEA